MHFPGYLCVQSRSGGGEFQTKTLRDDSIWEGFVGVGPFLRPLSASELGGLVIFRGKFRCCFSRPHSILDLHFFGISLRPEIKVCLCTTVKELKVDIERNFTSITA
ncbi:hypothetical protein AVEN_202409-1 [Araneus ventricosus]|uniref:Uncharacterized protein n=1 Tax=Araneus ventricosus TaxID=182803 RepID=A0A4Y2X595_ARAVE|nr:hypothetical protein AVEN_202409-1 [Araneus ventricosus]